MALRQLDADIARGLASFHGANSLVDSLAASVSSYSSAFFAAAFFGAVVFSYFFRGKDRAGLIISAALIMPAVIIINHIIRIVVSRPRPFEVLEGVIPLVSRSPGNSFPSNHAAAGFAVACFIYMVKPAAGIVFFVLSFVVSFSRVYAGLHYPSDILAGMALAGVISVLTGSRKAALARSFGRGVRFFKKREPDDNTV